jgi:hypothetical protein
MLWVEYEATERIDPQEVENIAEAIGKLISPFPVAIFDESEFGHGLICYKESLPEDEDPNLSDVDSEDEQDYPIETRPLLEDNNDCNPPARVRVPALTIGIPNAFDNIGLTSRHLYSRDRQRLPRRPFCGNCGGIRDSKR